MGGGRPPSPAWAPHPPRKGSLMDYPLTTTQAADEAAAIEAQWYLRTVPDGNEALRERSVRCRFVFTPDAGPDLAWERCPGETFHVSGLCDFHRQGARQR